MELKKDDLIGLYRRIFPTANRSKPNQLKKEQLVNEIDMYLQSTREDDPPSKKRD